MAKTALLALPLLSLGGCFLFAMKKESAFGRLLKVQVIWNHITDNFWLGTGLGRFSWRYPQWQADYFKTNESPPLEYYLSADESYIIFNEWLQLFKETGIIGFLVFIALLIFMFRAKSKNHSRLLLAAKATVTAILVCGFTAYPLHVNALLFLLFFSFSVAFMTGDNQLFFKKPRALSKPLARIFLLLVMLFAACASYVGVRRLAAVYKWNNLTENYSMPCVQRRAAYSALYPLLKHDGKFLTDYGDCLMRDCADYPQASMVLENAGKYFISQKTIYLAGYSCLQMKNFPKAIEHFGWLSNYLPNRFSPKFELLKIYKETGDTAKARETGRLILTMPIKIPSGEVDRIKQETKIIMRDL